MLGISDAVELTRKIGDLVKAGVTIDLQEKIVELREAVMNAREEILQLRAENLALKERDRDAAAWADAEARYPLVKAPGGAVVRHTSNPPEHYVCPTCFANKKVIPLQDRDVRAGYFDCPSCEAEYPVNAVERGPGSFEPESDWSGGRR